MSNLMYVFLRHYQQYIPVQVLGISKTDYPELKLKAWTNRVMTAYLAVAMKQQALQMNQGERPSRFVLGAAVCKKLSQWLLQVEMCPRKLTQEQANHMNTLAFEYLSCFAERMFFFCLLLQLCLTV